MKRVFRPTFSAAISALIVATALHWFLVLVVLSKRMDMPQTVRVEWDVSLLMIQLRIGTALFIALAGLFSRRMVGFVFTSIALVWVLGEYVFWYFRSIKIQNMAGLVELPQSISHTLNLYGASWINIGVLVLVLLACLTFLFSVSSRRKENASRIMNSK
jgi:hypothetical protein